MFWCKQILRISLLFIFSIIILSLTITPSADGYINIYSIVFASVIEDINVAAFIFGFFYSIFIGNLGIGLLIDQMWARINDNRIGNPAFVSVIGTIEKIIFTYLFYDYPQTLFAPAVVLWLGLTSTLNIETNPFRIEIASAFSSKDKLYIFLSGKTFAVIYSVIGASCISWVIGGELMYAKYSCIGCIIFNLYVWFKSLR